LSDFLGIEDCGQRKSKKPRPSDRRLSSIFREELTMDDSGFDSSQASQPDIGQYRDMMRGWARRAGLGPDDASDIVQEAMLKAVSHWPELADLGEKQRRAWLKTTTRRTALDAIRHRKRAKRGGGNLRSLDDLVCEAGAGNRQLALVEPVADDTSPSKRAEFQELRDQVLRDLPDDQREICALILQEKWSPEKVAEHLGISCHHVLLKASAGMVRLRQALKGRAKAQDAPRARGGPDPGQGA
jgi:RNA polymerase sigma factor (sigma-70 family)